ncbi:MULTISPECIES: GNAT family N-acetyltransferase [unclassified Sphingomonas]|uniref:GNAT family N-acetyltransferase n=1 Tax=unclassified Sphingomonas TaxID=196159 RepID=UPI000A6B35BE|nr:MULTISPECIES: GNAT family N-acetyltransferase [unclassified Sphingomonas]
MERETMQTSAAPEPAPAESRTMRLRPMTQEDIDGVHRLSKGEQWPHRVEDLADMLAVGTGTVAELNGEVVATTMWWRAGPAIATLGMVIVSRRHRGAGIGRIMMDAVLDQIAAALGPDAAIQLNATEDGLPLYRKLGFSGVGEILQHQGAAFQAPLVPLGPGERLRPMGERDGAVVDALVRAGSGLDRPAVMTVLRDKAHGVVLTHGDEVSGVALFRRFGRGYVVGPVIAPDVTRAKALIAQWIGSRSGEFIRLDIHGDSGLGPWLEELGLVRVGRVVTMVRGGEPVAAAPATSFAIVSQALC